MREIKFRAWDSGRKEWRGVALDNLGNQLMWQPISQSRHAYAKLSSNFLTISFYTGLKDKNGKEIYEGDIYKPAKYQGKQFVVEWPFNIFYDSEQPVIAESGEVIGNIYENPELLSE